MFHSFEKLLQLMYVRKSKNNFVKMSKKLTEFFISSKENTSVLKKQETMATVSVSNDIEKHFHSLYIISFSKTKFSKKY